MNAIFSVGRTDNKKSTCRFALYSFGSPQRVEGVCKILRRLIQRSNFLFHVGGERRALLPKETVSTELAEMFVGWISQCLLSVLNLLCPETLESSVIVRGE